MGVTVGGWWGTPWAWSLQGLLGYLCCPFTAILGVPLEGVPLCARLIGERLVLTEVQSYLDLKAAIANPGLQPRSVLITTYALYGFAHLASLGKLRRGRGGRGAGAHREQRRGRPARCGRRRGRA